MHRNQKIILDIKEIEKELNETYSGVVTILLDTDKLYQTAINFVYLDKNIYIYLDKNDEQFENMKFNCPASFSVVKTEKQGGKEVTYRLKGITVSGEIRIVDENKIIEQVKDIYRNKYSARLKDSDYEVPENLVLCIIDSSEIKAISEEGN